MSSSCVDNTEDMSIDEEIHRLSVEIELLKRELNNKTELLKIKQVMNFYPLSMPELKKCSNIFLLYYLNT